LTWYTQNVYQARMSDTYFWKRGEKTTVAESAGLELRELTDFLAGRRGFSLNVARKLEAATTLVLGVNRRVPAAAWLRVEEHPAIKEAGHVRSQG